MHFHAPVLRVVARFVAESREIEIRVQLAVDSREKIQIERSRGADGIVIGRQQLRKRLFQIRAEQQRIAADTECAALP